MREEFKKYSRIINSGAGNKIYAKIAEIEEIIAKLEEYLKEKEQNSPSPGHKFMEEWEKKIALNLISSGRSKIRKLNSIKKQKNLQRELLKMRQEHELRAQEAKLIGLGINLALSMEKKQRYKSNVEPRIKPKEVSIGSQGQVDVANDNSEEMRIIRATALKNMNQDQNSSSSSSSDLSGFELPKIEDLFGG